MQENSEKIPENNEKSTEEIESEERKELDNFITELRQKYGQKTTLRTENIQPKRPQEDYFTKCDSSLKKNTAFVKKLKQFTASQLDSLLKDMSSLNLTKYISEVSSAIVEAKLKMNDIAAMLILCSKLHQLYADFSTNLFENWQKILHLKSGDKIANPSKMRVDLRLYGELVSIGIFTNKVGLPLLGACLTALINQDKDEHCNLSIILSFCRHCGDEYAGIIPKQMLELSKKYSIELPKSNLLPADKQQNLKNLLKDYYLSLCEHLKSEHKQLQHAEKSKRKMMESKGEISSDKKEQLEMIQNSFEKLLASTQQMSDFLNEEMPELLKEVEAPIEGSVLETTDDQILGQLDPWGDEETKNFYVELPDLRLYLPNWAVPKEKNIPDEPAITEEVLDMDIDPEQDDENIEPINIEQEINDIVEEEPAASLVPNAPHIIKNKQYLDQYLQNLQNCVNKELIDSAAIDFLLNLNTKNNRKKLVKTLFGVQRTRLDLLPMYARLVAIINLVTSDVAVDLCQMLKNDFKYHIKKRDQITIETKIKVTRYIGELVKFGIYNKIEALFCLKYLLQNFSHHHIEMTCAFLEVCGQYLYNSRESRLRTNIYLEQMMRLKTATALDSRYSAQIENSYYLVKPPEGVGLQQKVRPIMHTYIRHLIFEELNKTNIEKMIKLMRRLNWDDKDTKDYAIKCLAQAYNVRYHLIRILADVVSGLSSYQEKSVVKVIDTVFEDIRAGLEIHSPKLAQRRVAMARYLGELYNYHLVESSNILNTLYSIISFGVTFSHEIPSEVDPPGSLFRLKLACVLLDTCGQYFTSATSRKRLDYFLIFFQHYYWFKKSDPCFTNTESHDLFPILTDHMYKECLKNVRPKLKLFKSYEKAKEAVENLRKELYPDLLKESETSEESDRPLKTIKEVDTDKEDTVTEDYTSEALGESDDEIKPRNEDDDLLDNDDLEMDDDLDDDDDEEDESQENSNPPSKTQEDLEFEQAFDKMSLECYQDRLKEIVKPNTKDIPIPMTMKTGKKTYEQLQEQPAENIEQQSVPFMLMIRSRSGKQQYKTFEAPSDSQLAVNLKLQEQKIKEENDRVKRLTLNITERIEEEDYQESLLQLQRSPATNRNKQQYQHQQQQLQQQQRQQKPKHNKGVPDVDAIFH
uniref:Putative nonsense-mediated mrna decay 2 protein n=1 Tax=Corethrella appendiculata TaxID=1370023 RepID=U5EXL6_9DIPT